jgi:hypothetical protein
MPGARSYANEIMISSASRDACCGCAPVTVEVRERLPLVLNIPHDQGTVERETSWRESSTVGEIAGMEGLNFQRLHPPHSGVHPKAV